MDLVDLEYLVALADYGSFARAATAVGVDVSTVSRRIARLEDEFGFTLFERSRAGSLVTAAGRSLVRHARFALAEIDVMKRLARGRSTAQCGEIRLSSQLSILSSSVQTWMAEWRRAHPLVEFRLRETHDREIVSELRIGEADAALMVRQSVSPQLESVDLLVEPLMLAVPERHLFSTYEHVRWRDLKTERLLVRSWEGSQTYREVQAGLVGSYAEFQPHAASYLTILGLVAMGEGVTMVLASHARISIPGVRYVPISEANAQVTVSLAWSPDREDSVLGNFVAFMRDRARAEARTEPKSSAPS